MYPTRAEISPASSGVPPMKTSPVCRGEQPLDQLSEVLFPDPLGPHERDIKNLGYFQLNRFETAAASSA